MVAPESQSVTATTRAFDSLDSGNTVSRGEDDVVAWTLPVQRLERSQHNKSSSSSWILYLLLSLLPQVFLNGGEDKSVLNSLPAPDAVPMPSPSSTTFSEHPSTKEVSVVMDFSPTSVTNFSESARSCESPQDVNGAVPIDASKGLDGGAMDSPVTNQSRTGVGCLDATQCREPQELPLDDVVADRVFELSREAYLSNANTTPLGGDCCTPKCTHVVGTESPERPDAKDRIKPTLDSTLGAPSSKGDICCTEQRFGSQLDCPTFPPATARG